MLACKKLMTAVVLYRTLWCCGATLLLVAIPLYKKSTAFYCLLLTGFMLMLLGIVIWVRYQTTECTTRPGAVCTQRQQQQQEYVYDYEPEKGMAVLTSITGKPASQQPAPLAAEPKSTPPLTTAVAQEISDIPHVSALKGKKSLRRRGVKLSENSLVKEFSKFEASNEISNKTVRSVATKKDGKIKRLSAGTGTGTGTGTGSTLVSVSDGSSDPFASLFATPSKAAQFVYPTVEDIRIERERHTHRPETPEIDRKRRTSMLREYAMQLGHPRDGSLLPLVQPL